MRVSGRPASRRKRASLAATRWNVNVNVVADPELSLSAVRKPPAGLVLRPPRVQPPTSRRRTASSQLCSNCLPYTSLGLSHRRQRGSSPRSAPRRPPSESTAALSWSSSPATSPSPQLLTNQHRRYRPFSRPAVAPVRHGLVELIHQRAVHKKQLQWRCQRPSAVVRLTHLCAMGSLLGAGTSHECLSGQRRQGEHTQGREHRRYATPTPAASCAVAPDR